MKKNNIIKQKGIKKVPDKRLVKSRNPLIAKSFTGEVNTLSKVIDDDKTKYTRKQKHKEKEEL